MKVMISAQQTQPDALIERRFGRCAYFVQFDTSNGSWQVLENPGLAQAGGAGVAAAQFVIQHKVDVVVSGDFGPNSARALSAAGIRMVLFAEDTSTARQALDQFLAGDLQSFDYTGQ